MSYILNIETSGTRCSVCISHNEEIMAFREIDDGYTHAENLHLFIDDVLNLANVQSHQISAVAVSKGPGSYTGLRIGVSAAKGLAYSLNIPLIGIDTLHIIALSAKAKNPSLAFYCPMIDARRMEVYTAVYDNDLKLKMPVEPLIMNETSILKFADYSNMAFFGDGMPKGQALLSTLKGHSFINDIQASAIVMPMISFKKFRAKQFENHAYFEPFYLKDFMILHKKSRIQPA